MHTPVRAWTQARITRRDVVRGLFGVTGIASVAGLTGCDLFGAGRPEQPGERQLTEFLSDTVALGNRYDAVLAAQPSLTPTLAALRDAHRSHAAALASALGAPLPAVLASAASVPGGRAQAVAELAAAEKTARDAAVTTCLASPPRLAALLGSIAAARASHLEILT